MHQFPIIFSGMNIFGDKLNKYYRYNVMNIDSLKVFSFPIEVYMSKFWTLILIFMNIHSAKHGMAWLSGITRVIKKFNYLKCTY